jgi:hypothetical protein
MTKESLLRRLSGPGLVLAIAIASPMVTPLPGQTAEPERAWILSAGALTYRVTDLNGWGVGPSVGAQRRLFRAIRLDLNAGILLSSSGFYDFTGAMLEAGPVLVHSGRRFEVGGGIGVSSIIGGDSDGTGGGWVGGYLAGHAASWLSSRVGLLARGGLRRLSTGQTSPSVALALALRL